MKIYHRNSVCEEFTCNFTECRSVQFSLFLSFVGRCLWHLEQLWSKFSEVALSTSLSDSKLFKLMQNIFPTKTTVATGKHPSSLGKLAITFTPSPTLQPKSSISKSGTPPWSISIGLAADLSGAWSWAWLNFVVDSVVGCQSPVSAIRRQCYTANYRTLLFC